MLDLIFRLALTAALGCAAYVDWRTMRVPFPLMWSLLIAGVVVAAFERQWIVVVMAVAAAVISSLPFMSAHLRIGLAAGFGLSFVWLATDQPVVVVTVIAIYFVWLLFEFNLVGGADATIAVGLLAMFHAPAFVALLALTTLTGSLLMLIARHRLGAGRVLLGAAINLWKMKPPTAQDLEHSGQPAVWKIALAGALFVWMPTFLRL